MNALIFLLALATAGEPAVCEPPHTTVRVAIPNPPKGKTAPPIVTITDAAGRVHEPVSKDGLLCFRGVAAGAATLKLSGDRWLTVEQPIEVKAGSSHTITGTTTTKLIVNWWTPNNLAAIAKAKPECGQAKAQNDPVAATLLVCPNRDPDAVFLPGQSKNCTATTPRMLSVEEPQGTLVFEQVPRGKHLIRFTAGGLPPIEREVRVFENETTEENVEARWAIVYGKVTKGGKGVHAMVFENAVTDPESGEYIAAFSRLPGLGTMRVVPCDGSQFYFYMADEAPVENAAFDIEIPDNKMHVDVVDAATGEPVVKARVGYNMPKGDDGGALFSAGAGHTDEKGRVTISPLLPKKKLKVCASYADYEHTCTEAFTIGASDEKQVRIALPKAVVRVGRVLMPGTSEINWTGRNGETERTRTDDQGRFRYKRPHAAGEIISVISPAGFFVTIQPQLEENQPLEIAVPQGRRRSFEVKLASTATGDGLFTIALGDLIVPHEGFSQYLMRREQQHALRPGSTTVVRDVIETAPISVIFAPLSFIRAREYKGWVFLPEVRSLPRQTLGDETTITFD
jgi:hypothetical protein